MKFAGIPASQTASHGAASTPERAAKLLGWRAQVGFEDGMKRTIEWYRANRGHRAEHDPSRAG